ncbi:MAG: extracellular solute-binding protein [Oscillospiraceae bacterium]|nr:extracellular solute-binding protein [Oscillospiraceae bacterium]
MEKTTFNFVEFFKKRRIPILSGSGVAALLLVLALVFTMCRPDSSGQTGENSAVGSSGTGESGAENSGDESEPETDSDSDMTEPASDAPTALWNPSNPGGSSADQKDIEVVNNCYTSGRKIAKDTVTFKIMIRDHAAGLAKYDDSAFAKYVLEQFNIKLQFEIVAISQVSEKTSLAYASKDLPDMFWVMASTSTIHYPYIDDGGYIAELGQYLDQYGPNIKNMFAETPLTKYSVTYDDGKFYMLPMYNDRDNFSWKFFINKTWLSNLRLSMPTSTDELRDVLTAFKEQDANKNGSVSDEIPMMIAAGDPQVGQIPLSLFSPFGLYSYTNAWCLDQSTDKVQYAFSTDGYRKGLQYYKGLRDARLLDANFRGAKTTDIYNRASASVQTVGVFAANSYGSAVSDESFAANYTLLPPLKSSGIASANWVNTPYENIWSDWFLLTKTCKYPEVAVRLADWLYSQEGTFVALKGPPGAPNYWNADSSGKIVINKKNIPAGKTDSDFIYSLTPGYPIPHYNSRAVIDLGNTALESYATQAEKNYSAQLSSMYGSLPPLKALPHLTFTAKETAEMQEAGGNFSSYAIQMQWNFIGGTANLNNDWDSYLSQLKQLGIEKIAAYYQTSYNRYKVWQKNNK